MRWRRAHFLFAAVLLATAWTGVSARAQSDAAERKYPLLSAYIYNFTQFTTWPDAAVKDAFTVCVLGRDPFGRALEPIRSRTVNGRKIAIRRFADGSDGLAACNILFISGSERENFATILSGLKGAPVLTMSDAAGFSGAGGMVEFHPAEDKIAIWIDLSVVRRAGISISSKLLALARIIG